MRQPIYADEYRGKAHMREDGIFDYLKPILRDANALLSFEWKAAKCQGKFVPVP